METTIHTGALFDALGTVVTATDISGQNLPVLIQIGKGNLICEIQGVFLGANSRSVILKASEPFVQQTTLGRQL